MELELISEKTPSELVGIYTEVLQLLSEETLDTERFFSLMVQREERLNAWMTTSDRAEKKRVIEHELQINQQLTALSEALRQEAKDSLSSLVKSRQAIKKYYK